MKYRRWHVNGGIYFFTVVTENRRPILIENINILRESFKQVKSKSPFSIEAIVILPDHLHTIWKLPENDMDYSKRWMLIKKGFSSQMPGFSVGSSKAKKREKGIWQRRYWEHVIRDEKDLKNHFDYIHYNPVKHGLVNKTIDWKYSSFTKCVEQGLYQPDWGEVEPKHISDINIE